MMSELTVCTLHAPPGILSVGCLGDTIVAAEFDRTAIQLSGTLRDRFGDRPIAVDIETEPVAAIKAYLAGDTINLDALDVDPAGTPFQASVWQALRRIPLGTTISYGELAEWVGRPKAARAVGRANGQNPIPVVIPCHRVIGKDGSLTGFGGGLAWKQWLLDLEGAPLQRQLFRSQASRHKRNTIAPGIKHPM
jgi:methylated-DNA-[protein]-cysteine S-methyltransferase